MGRKNPRKDYDYSKDDEKLEISILELKNVPRGTLEFLALIKEGDSVIEMVNKCNKSRATIYRYINDMERIGIIETGYKMDCTTNHSKKIKNIEKEVILNIK